ncbi:MAG TPA: DUF6588 family protein [Chryseosolibacter sp.]
MKLFCRVSVLIALLAASALPSFAQDDIEELLEGSISDANKLIGAYVDPVMKSLSLGLNQGWYNTAKPHKIAGVDLTITVNAMTIPTSETMFRAADLKLQEVALDETANGGPNVSTILGPAKSSPFYLVDDPTQRFNSPEGLDLKAEIKTNKVPVPMVHLGFGLPKNTDLKFRYIPTLDLGDDGTVKMFGVGVMHDIKQWIPGIKLMPFDLSAFVGYTRFEAQTQLDAANLQNADQRGIFTMNATTMQVLIGKKFSVITFYGGVGYNIAKSNLALKGRYDLDEDGTEELKDPVNLNFAASGPRATVGTRLKLAVFTFHADYTLQKYKCLTVGFGISVR